MAGSDLSKTLNVSGQPGPTPREYDRHERHTNQAKRRHDDQENAWLVQQAARLSTTTSVIFAKLKKYKAVTIAAASSLASIP